MDNPSFMMSALYERQREIGELMNGRKRPGEAAPEDGGKQDGAGGMASGLSAAGGAAQSSAQDANGEPRADEKAKRGVEDNQDMFRVDPFFLLREVAEMGNLQATAQAQRDGTLTMQQEMAK